MLRKRDPFNKNIAGTEISRLVNSRDYFWSERFKATATRLKILDLLIESYEPLTVLDIQSKIEASNPATIYRTLKILMNMDLVRRVHGLNRKRSRFEIKPGCKFT